MKQIQEWLGHSDFSTTANVYAHLDYHSKITSAEAILTGLKMQPEARESKNARKTAVFEAILCSGRMRGGPENPGGTTVSGDQEFSPRFSPEFSPETVKTAKRKRRRGRKFEQEKRLQKRENPYEHWVSCGLGDGGGGGIRTPEGFHPT